MHVDHATSLMTQADSTPRRPTSSVAASSGNIDLSGSRSKEAKFVAIGKAPYKPVKRSPLAQSWVIEPVDSESNDERAPGSSSSTANPSPVPTAGTSNITRKVESGSNVVAINGITIPAEALARFKVKVSLRKGSHSRISEEFLRDVVLVALKDCNIEGAVRQMAAFDPSLGPAEKSQRLWQLRWVVDKWGLHPDASASTKAILGPEGEGRKVAGSRRLQAYLAAQDRKE
ncbi:hypothetical protein FRC03_012167 [Tulasnella sp. 419]|nr:hypothetical protein FRC03_012167 [Tulasnella sp. 419]